MAGHLTLEEREVMAQRNAEGWFQKDIARELGRDKGSAVHRCSFLPETLEREKQNSPKLSATR